MPTMTTGLVEPPHPLASPTLPSELNELCHILVPLIHKHDTPTRLRAIEESVTSGVFRDPRLLPLWVRALDCDDVGDLVAERVVPALGEAAAPHLEQQFDPTDNPGKVYLVRHGVRRRSGEMHRLQALVALRGEAARPLVDACLRPLHRCPEPPSEEIGPRRALPQGTRQEICPWVRAEAVRALPRVDPEQAETRALALLDVDEGKAVCVACIEVLGKFPSVASLEALLTTLLATGHESSDVRYAAARELRGFAHPETTSRLLALISPEMRHVPVNSWSSPEAPKKVSRAEKNAAKLRAEQVSRDISQLGFILEALPGRWSPALVETLLDLHRTHTVWHVRTGAEKLLASHADSDLLATLSAPENSATASAGEAAVRTFFEHDPGTVFERLQPYLTDTLLASRQGLAAAMALLDGVIGQSKALGDHVHNKQSPDQETPLEQRVPGQADATVTRERDENRARYPFRRDPRWGDVALRLLDRRELSSRAMILLANLEEPRAALAISQRLVPWSTLEEPFHALDVLRELDNPEALVGLRATLSSLARGKKPTRTRWLQELIAHLERDRSV